MHKLIPLNLAINPYRWLDGGEETPQLSYEDGYWTLYAPSTSTASKNITLDQVLPNKKVAIEVKTLTTVTTVPDGNFLYSLWFFPVFPNSSGGSNADLLIVQGGLETSLYWGGNGTYEPNNNWKTLTNEVPSSCTTANTIIGIGFDMTSNSISIYQNGILISTVVLTYCLLSNYRYIGLDVSYGMKVEINLGEKTFKYNYPGFESIYRYYNPLDNKCLKQY